jgi:hypothetical protein
MKKINLIQLFRTYLAGKVVTCILALQLLNASVDPEDREHFGTQEDLTHNDLESLVEIVLEEFLDFDNIMGESDESDTEPVRHGFHTLCVYQPTQAFFFSSASVRSPFNLLKKDQKTIKGVTGKDTPPPKPA